jgi:hypothetical protein
MQLVPVRMAPDWQVRQFREERLQVAHNPEQA